MGKTVPDGEAEIVRGLDSVQSACSVGHEMVGMCNMSDVTQSYTISEPLVGIMISSIPTMGAPG